LRLHFVVFPPERLQIALHYIYYRAAFLKRNNHFCKVCTFFSINVYLLPAPGQKGMLISIKT
jgi:hypothetical protein